MYPGTSRTQDEFIWTLSDFILAGALLLGASLARFRPRGMARTMFATAGSQAIVPVIAMVIWQPQVATREEIIGVLGVFILNGLFVLLFTRSALLFRNAAKQPERG